MNLKFSIAALAFSTLLNVNAQDTLKTYIFGHSLINHEYQVNITPSQETSVPHWFHFLAEQAGYNYAVSGQYGFLPQHANLPPIAQWGFDYVAPAWDSDNYPFSYPDFDNILITPGNFIQYQGPSIPYFNDSLSPLDYTSEVFDWVNAEEDSMTLYVYENWPDMGGFLSQGFPPSQSEWQAYNNYLHADFHDWFIEYHDSLMLAHPNHCVRMIPVGPAISNLLAQSPFDQIAIDTLYEDDAPHGRPTIYFLAALTTYMAMYGEPAPASYQVPAIIDPIVANNYQQAIDFLWNELQTFQTPSGDSRVFCESTVGLEVAEQVDFEVYPNPFESTLTINSAMPIDHIELLDASGRVLIYAKEKTVDVSTLRRGTYLCKIALTSGLFSVKKIIKR
jgi:hypothetical protein